MMRITGVGDFASETQGLSGLDGCRYLYGERHMTKPNSVNREIQPQHPPVVLIPQDTFIPRRRLQRVLQLFPAGQFVRYLCVGVFNTCFGYTTFAIVLTLLNLALPVRFLYLTVILASILTTPLNITIAYLTYKFFVFRTKGNYLREWLKCFAVYGTGMIPGLIVLSALTRFIQTLIHSHAIPLNALLNTTERHLNGRALTFLQHIATGKAMAGYIAGAIVIGISTIYSFIGHRTVTFRSRK
jgi:putative flippase GtrA